MKNKLHIDNTVGFFIITWITLVFTLLITSLVGWYREDGKNLSEIRAEQKQRHFDDSVLIAKFYSVDTFTVPTNKLSK